MRRHRWQESLRSMKMHSGIAIDDSSPVNPHIAASTAELNSNEIGTDCINGSSVGRPEPDLGRCLQTIGGGTIVDSSLASWTKLDSFYEGVLGSRFGISNRILKRSGGIRRITNGVCNRRPSVEGCTWVRA